MGAIIEFTFEKRRELLRRAMRGFARQEIAPTSAEIEETTELIQDLNGEACCLGDLARERSARSQYGNWSV